MYPGTFESFFINASNQFRLSHIARKLEPIGKIAKRNSDTPIWDTIDLLDKYEYIDIGNGYYVSSRNFLKRPVRILFFILLTEFEARLFKIHESNGINKSDLNEMNLNNLIINLLNSELMNLQTTYPSKGEFREDLKAISSFRNVIVHVNKKLEESVKMETIIKRKEQLVKTLYAFQEILDGIYAKSAGVEKIELSNEELDKMVDSFGSLDNSIDIIYSMRPARVLVGEDSIFLRLLGDDFKSVYDFKPKYKDVKRDREVKTELAESMEGLELFDKKKDGETKIKLIFEVADIIFQRRIMELRYKDHPSYKDVSSKVDSVLDYFKKELEKRDIPFKSVEEGAKLKYGARAWLRLNGFSGKNKEFESKIGRIYFLEGRAREKKIIKINPA